MNLNSKRKTLLDIELSIWGRVKYFATIKEMSVNKAVQLLLEQSLNKWGSNPIKDHNDQSLKGT